MRKIVGMSPDVSAVEADEDGDVAHDLNAAAGRLGMQSLPLFEEGELHGTRHFNLRSVTFTSEVLGIVVATRNFLRPLVPRLAAIFLTENFEQRIVFEPPRVFLAEAFETAAIPGRSVLEESTRSLFDEGVFRVPNFSKLTLPVAGSNCFKRAASIQPRSARRSRLIMRGLPAKADVLE